MLSRKNQGTPKCIDKSSLVWQHGIFIGKAGRTVFGVGAMRIIRGLEDVKKAPLKDPVVTLGNFDGVHLGHQAIFKAVAARAFDTGGASVVFTFEPHPLKVLAPHRSPRLLCTFREKMEQIEAAGVDAVICARFTPQFASQNPGDFVDNVLVGAIGVKDLFVGHDYAFGRDRKGDAAFLREAGARRGFGVHVVAPVKVEGILVSSTKIRQLIMDGEVCLASKLLGRPYSIEGTVIPGHSRGRDIGFPTANITTPNELAPKEGVYAVSVDVEGRLYIGAANIGRNPTFGDEATSYEVHLLDYEGDLYGKFIKMKFIKRVRDEVRFGGAHELAGQIKRDVERVRAIFADES